MKKITPFLWFDDNAEEAAKFYVSVFKKGRIVSRMTMGKKKGKPVGVTFQIEGLELIAFNGGPHYKLSPAISLFVDCKTQKEVDTLWNKLSKGGEESRCGWLTDKFGMSWQIIPSMLSKNLYDKDPVRAGRVFEAMLKMGKIDIAKLQKAYKGEA
jgi:predicted 3-demethylubiquinone-9 3-methyltransferase (glyoxalase superfamily)